MKFLLATAARLEGRLAGMSALDKDRIGAAARRVKSAKEAVGRDATASRALAAGGASPQADELEAVVLGLAALELRLDALVGPAPNPPPPPTSVECRFCDPSSGVAVQYNPPASVLKHVTRDHTRSGLRCVQSPTRLMLLVEAFGAFLWDALLGPAATVDAALAAVRRVVAKEPTKERGLALSRTYGAQGWSPDFRLEGAFGFVAVLLNVCRDDGLEALRGTAASLHAKKVKRPDTLLWQCLTRAGDSGLALSPDPPEDSREDPPAQIAYWAVVFAVLVVATRGAGAIVRCAFAETRKAERVRRRGLTSREPAACRCRNPAELLRSPYHPRASF